MACDDAPSRPFGGERATGEDSGVTLTAAPETQDLLPAVTSLRDEVGTTSLPFDLPGVRAAERGRTELLRQLDDYVLPRLSSIDAPLLAVVGGSTGAGKSTLVNSVVGAEVSRSGRAPPDHAVAGARAPPRRRALVHRRRASSRTSRGSPAADAVEGQATVRLVTSIDPAAGLALLDAPDIDSVVSANRELARQLLAAADLWLFVTTAARYADAVPWDLLRQARDRGTSVAVVLDRVPPGRRRDPHRTSRSMLREQGLAPAPIFTVPESHARRRRPAAARCRWSGCTRGSRRWPATRGPALVVVRQTLTRRARLARPAASSRAGRRSRGPGSDARGRSRRRPTVVREAHRRVDDRA